MLVDSTNLSDDSQLDSDVCIIGGGPAGIVLADSLRKAGLQVCLAEAGGLFPKDERSAASIAEQLDHPVIVHPRTRFLGGMSNAWGGVRGLYVRLMPFDPIDFVARPWVPNSGWPFAYGQLKPFYESAFRLLDSISSESFDPAKHDKQLLAAFDNDILRSSMVHLAAPFRFGERYRDALEQAGNVKVLLNAYATEIEENPSEDRISLIHAVTKNGRKLRFSAGTFVLACGGLETARLMLASRQKHSCGVGNQYDLVGRFYMQHPKGSHGHVALRRRTETTGYVRGFRINGSLFHACISLSEQQQRREELLNHRVVLAPILQLSESRLSRLYGELRASWRSGHHRKAFRRGTAAGMIEIPGAAVSVCKNILRSMPYGTLHYRVVNHMEQIPDPTSRVELTNDIDCFGVPKLRTNWHISFDEKRSLCRFHELLDESIRQHGIGRLYHGLSPEMDDWPIASSSSHDLGTARMHTNPRRGVTNADGRVHSVENLYVVGGALFPTGGHANPTLTIIALALRMAAFLKDRIKTKPKVSLKEGLHV